MKVVRTFHPIGQGAFYSERFYMEDQQGTVHNIVYGRRRIGKTFQIRVFFDDRVE